MSLYQFIASDKPLPEVENPYMERLSANELSKRKIKLDKTYMKRKPVNNNEKIFLYYPSEESFDEMVLYKDPGYARYVNEYSNKQYFVAIQWVYTEKRAEQLVNYLKKQLKQVDELEVWSIWLDEHEEAVVDKIKAYRLTVADIAFLDLQEGFDKPQCLVIKS